MILRICPQQYFPQVFGSQQETKIHDMLGNSDCLCFVVKVYCLLLIEFFELAYSNRLTSVERDAAVTVRSSQYVKIYNL